MPIRWGDMDAFGHVNNTVYFRYMEQTRIEWLQSVYPYGDDLRIQGPVIVNASMNFRLPLHYPGDLVCRMLAGPPGRSSFDTGIEIRRTDTGDTVFADGRARIVWVDHQAGRSMPLPDSIRSILPAPTSVASRTP